MSNKYSNLVEEINKKEEIAEQKDNLAEQLGQVIKNVSDVKETVGKLETAIDDLKKIVVALTAASKSTDNAVGAITHRYKIAEMLERNKDRCYEIINNGDGVYFGRKTFIRLYIVFCTFFGIILLEIVYGLLKLFGS